MKKKSNPISFGVLIWLTILMLGNPAIALSEDSDLELLESAKTEFGDPEELLDELRNMRFSGEVPSLKGFSPAKEVKIAPPVGANVYTAAYKSKSNCVVFFSPLGKNEHDFALNWDGGKCNGKPIHGMGTLTITHKADADDGAYSYVLVFRGRFDNGMLSGAGEKEVYYLDPNGKLRDSRVDSGEFAYGMLNGFGSRTWTGPSNSEPSAWSQKGNFKDSTPSGLITLSRLHPFAGVEADVSEKVLNSDGDTYQYQWYNNGKKSVRGVMYFYGDPVQWQIITSEVNGNGATVSPKNANLVRVGSPTVLTAHCNDWDIQQERWSCSKGVASFQWVPRPGTMIDGEFEIPVPFNASGGAIRKGDGSRVLIGSFDHRYEMSCNKDISICRGKNIVGFYANLYLWGETEFRNGHLIPVSGTLYKSSEAYERNPSKDEKFGSCEIFSSPTHCDHGTLLRGNATWYGGYTLHGLEYSSSSGYEFSDEKMRVTAEGNGRLTWNDGKWVKGYKSSDQWISIGECDDPNSSSKFTCSLEGNNVVIKEH